MKMGRVLPRDKAHARRDLRLGGALPRREATSLRVPVECYEYIG